MVAFMGSNSRAGQIRGAACPQPRHPAAELGCNTLIWPRLGQLPSKGCPPCQTAPRSRQTLVRCRVEPPEPVLQGHLHRCQAGLQHQPRAGGTKQKEPRYRRSKPELRCAPGKSSCPKGLKASVCPAALPATRPSHRRGPQRWLMRAKKAPSPKDPLQRNPRKRPLVPFWRGGWFTPLPGMTHSESVWSVWSGLFCRLGARFPGRHHPGGGSGCLPIWDRGGCRRDRTSSTLGTPRTSPCPCERAEEEGTIPTDI